ncbi:MAG: hypothetical protein EZS28_017803 [Streblomastix strix]|uniref:Uncharacterized protein n=1 Tax=Streblomastix strix TaxID=222440 RepID=A0A5J4VVE1_9EUKA|nr:MAG: hypothetical protein EZS28_017803 [Streblomastix strix]
MDNSTKGYIKLTAITINNPSTSEFNSKFLNIEVNISLGVDFTHHGAYYEDNLIPFLIEVAAFIVDSSKAELSGLNIEDERRYYWRNWHHFQNRQVFRPICPKRQKNHVPQLSRRNKQPKQLQSEKINGLPESWGYQPIHPSPKHEGINSYHILRQFIIVKCSKSLFFDENSKEQWVDEWYSDMCVD